MVQYFNKDEKVLKEGVLPKINIVAAKPLILEKESVPAIPSGHDTAKKELLSGSEQIKLNKSNKDNVDNDKKWNRNHITNTSFSRGGLCYPLYSTRWVW